MKFTVTFRCKEANKPVICRKQTTLGTKDYEDMVSTYGHDIPHEVVNNSLLEYQSYIEKVPVTFRHALEISHFERSGNVTVLVPIDGLNPYTNILPDWELNDDLQIDKARWYWSLDDHTLLADWIACGCHLKWDTFSGERDEQANF